jgi:hypothetical protein
MDKTFELTEQVGFQFRAEAFNVFNHAQYGYDPMTATNISAPCWFQSFMNFLAPIGKRYRLFVFPRITARSEWGILLAS